MSYLAIKIHYELQEGIKFIIIKNVAPTDNQKTSLLYFHNELPTKPQGVALAGKYS
ncbi:MAG: hypothetical protein ACJAWS_002972 [Oleiphilaceae bacterium]|jgi:hypothetical protein